MPKINVTGSQSTGFTPLPIGTYDFLIDACEEGVSKSSQNPQLKLNLHVEGGDHTGKKTADWFSLTPKSIWKLADLVEATGAGDVVELSDKIDPDSGKPMINIELETDDLIGCVFRADVTHEEFPAGSGKMQNRLNKIRNPKDDEQGGQPAAPAAPVAPAAPTGQAAANTAAATAQGAPPPARRRRAV